MNIEVECLSTKSFLNMNRIFLSITVILILSTATADAQGFKKFKDAISDAVGIESTGGALSEDMIADGLKEALVSGVEKGVDQLSQPDGYFKDLAIKILLPEEAQKVEKTLRQIGMGSQVDKAIESLNRAAEDAATGATEIFVDAIKQMTITDALDILQGEDDAASNFLDSSTRSALSEKFKPVIKVSLDKVDATKHWNTIFSKYNKMPFVKPINPELDDYVTEKAIDGLFVQIKKQEKEIRENPGARVTDLLKKVFK